MKLPLWFSILSIPLKPKKKTNIIHHNDTYLNLSLQKKKTYQLIHTYVYIHFHSTIFIYITKYFALVLLLLLYLFLFILD